MDDAPQSHIANSMQVASAMTKAVDPPLWMMNFIAAFPVAGIELKSWVTLVALLLPLFVLAAVTIYHKMQYRNRKPFPFLELPQELRNLVYENLLKDPVYPPPPTPSRYQSSTLDWMIPGRWTSASRTARIERQSRWVFLANKQVYSECLEIICKRRTLYLSVSPDTYKPITASSASPEDNNVWTICPATLANIQTCKLKLITTSSMLGRPDPRDMTSSSWPLGQRIRAQLKHMQNIKSFTLEAKALGDPLWNPLWIWYHASQSFKIMGTPASDTVPIGPQLTQITFSLDTWSPGENYLKRDAEDKWTWYCMKHHPVCQDLGLEITVREFCGLLYRECRICRPETEEEAE